jgi:hypothetical protein
MKNDRALPDRMPETKNARIARLQTIAHCLQKMAAPQCAPMLAVQAQ